MAAGAVGAPGTPGLLDTVDEALGCLLDVLGRRRIEPVLPGRDGGGGWTALRVLTAACVTPECSTMLPIAMFRSPPPRMLPCPVGDGNCVSLKSVDADSRLLWRSSKLTEGRKSNEVVVESAISSDAPLLPPKENRE